MEKERVAGSLFGTLLRNHRLAAGLSQETLAEQARMSINGISALERGNRRYPYHETVVLLAKALNLAPAAAAQLEAAAARPRLPRAGADEQEASADQPRSATNIPLQRTSLIGRDADIANIAGRLRDSRLVTVTGAGGVGKTRTALGVGEAYLANTKAEVWIVELAPVQESFVASAVAQVLGIRESANRPLLETLVANLKQKSLLLILDNCEHVIAKAAAVTAALLNGCLYLQILATSREPLRIAGEQLYRLPSLTVPTSQEASQLNAAAAADYAAILLFIQRAQSIDHGFTLSDDTAPIVADICRRLDGLPLAIELAAARIQMLSLRQLRERLDERLRMLTGGSRDALPRQQTIRALIDWSHDLLDERERTLLRRLGIFVSGFTLDGAVTVCSGVGLCERDVFDMLSSLVDKSLVLAVPDRDSLRYRLLESTRAYAIEKLWAASECDKLARRHLRYLRDRFAEVWTDYEASGRPAEMDRLLVDELDDVRAALDYVGEHRGEIEVGAELLAAIGARLARIGLAIEGSSRIKHMMSLMPANERRLTPRLWTALATMTHRTHPTHALEAASTAVSIAREADDLGVLCHALTTHANLLIDAGLLDGAAADLREAETITPTWNVPLHLSLFNAKITLAKSAGDYDAAIEGHEELWRRYQQLGNMLASNTTALSIAEIEHRRGRTAKALAVAQEIIPSLRTGGDPFRHLVALACLCGYLVALDRLPEARNIASEVFQTAFRDDCLLPVAIAIEHTALALVLDNDVRCGAQLAGYSEATFRRLGFRRQYTEQTTRTRLEALLHEHLALIERDGIFALGAALASEEASALALASLAMKLT